MQEDCMIVFLLQTIKSPISIHATVCYQLSAAYLSSLPPTHLENCWELSPVEFQTMVPEDYAKISQSRRRPLLVLNVKVLVGAFNQEKALVGAFSVIVQLH